MDAHLTAPKDLKEVREFVSPNANPHQQRQKQQQQQQQLPSYDRRTRSMPEVCDRDSRWGATAEPNLDLSPPAFRGMTSPSSARKLHLPKRVRSTAATSPERGAKREASLDSIDPPFSDCDHSESESGEKSCLFDTDSAMGTMTLGEAPAMSTSNSPRKPSPNRIPEPASSEPPGLQLKKNWSSPVKQTVKSAMKKKYVPPAMLQKDSKESSMSTISSCVAPEEENSSLTSSGSKLKLDAIFRITASSGRGEAAPPMATTPLNPETCENRWNAYGAAQLTISSLEAVLPPAFQGSSAPARVCRMVSADSCVPPLTDDDNKGDTHDNTSSSGDEFLVDDRLPPAYQVPALNEHKRKSSTVQDGNNNNQSPNKPAECDAQQSFSHTELLQTTSQNAAFGQNISSLSMSTTQDRSSKLEGMDRESSSENTRDLAPPSLRSAKSDSNVQIELPSAYKPIQTPKSASPLEQEEQQLKEQEKSWNGETPRLKDAATLAVKDSAKKGRKASYANMEDVKAAVDARPREEHALEKDDSTPKEGSWKVKRVITIDSFRRENENGDGEVSADRAPNSEQVPADDSEAKDGSDQAQPENNNFRANEEKEEEYLPIDDSDDPQPEKKRSCKVGLVMTVDASRREKEENETSSENEAKPSDQAAPDIRNDLGGKKQAGKETIEDTNVFAKDVNYATNEEPVLPDDQSDTSDPPPRKRSWKVKRLMTVDSFRRENDKGDAGSGQDEEVSGMDENVSKDAKGKSDNDQATTPDSDPAEDPATAQLSSSSDLPSADSPVQPQETGVATESEVLSIAEQAYDDTPKPKRSWKAKRILTLDSFRRENEAEDSTKEEGKPEKKTETSASAKITSVPVGHEPTENRDAFAPDIEETNQVGTEPSQINSSESTLTERPKDSKEVGIKPRSAAELGTKEINDSSKTKSLKKKVRRGSTGALAQKRERTTNEVPPAPSSSPRKSRKQKRRGSTGALKKREKKKISEYGRRLKKEAKVDDDYEAWLAKNFQASSETSTNAGESPANPDQNTSLDCEPTTHKSEISSRFEDSKLASNGRHSDHVKSGCVMETSTEFGIMEINDGGEVKPRKKHKRRDSTELLAQKREQALLPKTTPPFSSAPKPLRRHKRRGSTGALAQKWEQELLPKTMPTFSPAPESSRKQNRRGSTGALAQRREEMKADAQIDSDNTHGRPKKDVGTSELKTETEPTPLHSSLDASFKQMEEKVDSASEEFAPFGCQPTDESSRKSDQPDALYSCTQQSQEDASQYGYGKEKATKEEASQYGYEYYETENATKEDASQYGPEKENATNDVMETRPRRKHKRRGSTGTLVHHWENQLLPTILPTTVKPPPAPPPSPIPARSRRQKHRGSMGVLAQHWEVKLSLSPDANAHDGMQAKESADMRAPIGTSSFPVALPVFSGQEDTSSEMDHVHNLSFDESFPFDCQPTISDRLSASGPCSMDNQMDSLQYGGCGHTGTIEIKDDTEVKPRRTQKRRGSTGVFVQKWEQKLQPVPKSVAAPLPLVHRRQKRRGSTGALAQMWEELSASPTLPRRSPKKREKTALKTDPESKIEFVANLSLTETSNDNVLRAAVEESGLREKKEASRSEHILDKEKTGRAEKRSGSAEILDESRRSSSGQSAGEPAQESPKKGDWPIGSSSGNLLPQSPKDKSKKEAFVAAASEHGTRSSKSSGRLKEEKKLVSRRRSSSTGRLKGVKKSQSGQSSGASVTSSKDRKEKSRSCSRSKEPAKEEKTPKERRRSNSSGRMKEHKASVAAASEHGTRSSKSSGRLKEEKKSVSRRRSSSIGRLKDPKKSQIGQSSVASVTSSKDHKKKSRSRSRSKGPMREEKTPKEGRRSNSSGRMKEQKKAKQKKSSASDDSSNKKSQKNERPSTEDEQFQANVQHLLDDTY